MEDSDDTAIIQAIQNAIPLEAKLRTMPTLVAKEWSAPIMSFPQLSSKGGVSMVPKDHIAEVIGRVGHTSQPTAILITQHPATLGALGSYPPAQVEFTVQLHDNAEDKEFRITRWCVQLGSHTKVLRIAEGTKIDIPQPMLRMVCKQPEEFGWPGQARASNVTNV